MQRRCVGGTAEMPSVTWGCEPPPELMRVIDASTQHRLVTEDTLHDLLAAVSYLAKREINSR